MAFNKVIKGNSHVDERGILKFFNDVDFTEVVRMYEITPKKGVIRAWQGHKTEKKWFYCSQGRIVVNLVAISNFDEASPSLKSEKKILTEDKPEILLIAEEHANGFVALEENSKLMVFSNLGVEQSALDDYRFKFDFWKADWNE